MTQIDSFAAATAQAAALVGQAKNILILCHREPDADTAGSGLGLANALRSIGKCVGVAAPDPVPANLDHLVGWGDVGAIPDAVDLVITVDAASAARLGSLQTWLEAGVPVVVMDHHVSNTGYGDVNVIDADAAATAEVVTRFLDTMAIPITPETAACLYAGLFRDTAGFRSDVTTGATLGLAARLIGAGADPALTAERIFGQTSLRQLRVEAHAIATMRSEAGGRLVWSQVSVADAAGASESEVEGGVEQLARTGAPIAILFHEIDAVSVEVHIRTREPYDAAALAIAMGGGGHRHRSGARINSSLAVARRTVLAAARAQIDSNEGALLG